jgi:hypothetical protein
MRVCFLFSSQLLINSAIKILDTTRVISAMA